MLRGRLVHRVLPCRPRRPELLVRPEKLGQSSILPPYITLSRRPFVSSGASALSAELPAENVNDSLPVQRTNFRSPPFNLLGTLDPTKLTPEDYVKPRYHLNATLLVYDQLRIQVYSRYSNGSADLDFPGSPQPPSNRPLDKPPGGFLYYHQYPHAPPLAGELRFRITPSNDPGSFPFGVDLMTERGGPWCLHLPQIAKRKTCAVLRHLLTVVDGTVSQQLMDLARANHHSEFFQTNGNTTGSGWLHSFGQPFYIDLHRKDHAFVLIGKDHITKSSVRVTVSSHTSFQRHYPFLGTIMCCFEPSPYRKHAGKRVAVVRVLRSLESDPIRPNPDYAGPPYPLELRPREGQLFMRMKYGKATPWAGDVDNGRVKGVTPHDAVLRTLFENAAEFGSV
ncbi:hypothetical protein L226DRAFT_139531 [Lentinus tigrinus ALCF2SS1-7]|uniref:Uncharacterized protein n=1 Tax=Lentinus tigrinus ALCF2SS1-6 TaxID=1328759 RepID=A0A5C2SXH6_9APHY|nr:hypothetical protein L227DRAFT_28440 [Lentinus tigrinus ALCF2SS1-6]RPD81494.1 hypothetical protein L226DRAFT_139531 [Lentinus tigrinus ALCF2SS1-7]